MNYQTTSVIWLLTLTLTGLMPAGLGIAQSLNPLQRVGRLHGVCWGDGYHACRDSGTRPLDDLPPAQRTTAVGAHHARILPIHDCEGATYYDQFDAMNRAHCDSPPVGHQTADSGNHPVERSWDVPENSPLDLIAPSVSIQPAIQRPTRPAPPVVKRQATQLATSQLATSQLATSHRENASPAVRLSSTPHLIAPVCSAPEPSYARKPAPIETPVEISIETLAVDHPKRLGGATPVTKSPGVSIETQYEFASQAVMLNPFLGRPTVEMAKRISDSETGFVRQPSYLK